MDKRKYEIVYNKTGKCICCDVLSSDEVFNIIMKNAPTNFWDDYIDDKHYPVGVFGKFYKVSEILKRVDVEKYNGLVKESWDFCKRDVIADIENMVVGEEKNIMGWIVKCLS